MSRRYLFLGKTPFNQALLLEYLHRLPLEGEVEFVNEYQGEIHSAEPIEAELSALLVDLVADLGLTLSFLYAGSHASFEEDLLPGALRFCPNQVCFPSDVILREIGFGEFSSYGPLVRLFRGLPQELLATVGAYLRAGMDACKAAKLLGLHRNTFNYRLSAFASKTGLDVREYHNAMLVELYFGLSGERC